MDIFLIEVGECSNTTVQDIVIVRTISIIDHASESKWQNNIGCYNTALLYWALADNGLSTIAILQLLVTFFIWPKIMLFHFRVQGKKCTLQAWSGICIWSDAGWTQCSLLKDDLGGYHWTWDGATWGCWGIGLYCHWRMHWGLEEVSYRTITPIYYCTLVYHTFATEKTNQVAYCTLAYVTNLMDGSL